MTNKLLHSVRDRIVSSEFLLRGTKPIVHMLRRGIANYGPSTTTISLNDRFAKFHTESFEEVRHFWPVLGEADELADLLSELQPTDTFYDLGAHVGIYTCFASQVVGEEGVVSFEPVQANIKRLRENLYLNNTSADIRPVAVSDENKQLEIDIDSNAPGTIGHLTKDTAKESDIITTVIGDHYIRENDLPLPNVMKIDIEGSECKALRGLKGSLGECRLIYCEVSDSLQKYGDSEEELVEILLNEGFEIEYIYEKDIVHGDIKATRTR